MPSQKRQLGDLGEKIALNYLKKQGYQILERNYQRPWGEIDIIAQKDKDIIFTEVKTRTSEMSTYPEESVRFKKQKRLIKTAESYLLEKKYSPQTNWQIDVIAIELNIQTRKADLKHIKNAVY